MLNTGFLSGVWNLGICEAESAYLTSQRPVKSLSTETLMSFPARQPFTAVTIYCWRNKVHPISTWTALSGAVPCFCPSPPYFTHTPFPFANFALYSFFLHFYLLILETEEGRERGRHRERDIDLLFLLFMHSFIG